jgi:putative hydrolase of HD superfamily
MQIESLLPFLVEADRLKNIDRQTLVHNGGRPENSAEHSWHLAIAVLVFQKLAPADMDINKAIRMALLHDIVEIDAGDMFIYGDLSTKKSKESAGLKRLMGLLPTDIAEEFAETWLEFEKGESAEAKYVSALDRFLPLYSNFLNEGYSWKNHGIPSSRVIAKNQPPIEAGLAPLWEVASKMIAEAINRGHLDQA